MLSIKYILSEVQSSAELQIIAALFQLYNECSSLWLLFSPLPRYTSTSLFVGLPVSDAWWCATPLGTFKPLSVWSLIGFNRLAKKCLLNWLAFLPDPEAIFFPSKFDSWWMHDRFKWFIFADCGGNFLVGSCSCPLQLPQLPPLPLHPRGSSTSAVRPSSSPCAWLAHAAECAQLPHLGKGFPLGVRFYIDKKSVVNKKGKTRIELRGNTKKFGPI